MAETFSFELKLVDSVSSAAKKAAAAVDGIGAKAGKAKHALDFSQEIERSHKALQKIEKDPGGYMKLLKVQKELAEQRRALANRAGVGKESFTEALGAKMNFGKMFGAAMLADVLVEGGMHLVEGLVEGAHKVVEVLYDGVKDAFKSAGGEQVRRLSYRLSLGRERGDAALEDVTRFTKLTGFTRGQTAQMFLPLMRAGFNQKSARQAFATATDVAAMQGRGGDMGAVNETLDFFKHVRTRGGFTKKMLTGILGDVGSTIPDFYKQLGKQLGVSAKTAESMAKQGGKIDPQLVMNMITSAVNKIQGGRAGTGGNQYAQTFEARIAKLKSLPEEYMEQLASSPSFLKASDAFGGLLEKLDPEGPAGERIMASINRMFDKVAGWIGDIDTDSLVDGIEDAVSAMADLLPSAKSLAGFFTSAAETMDDMVNAIRLMSAYTSGDKTQVQAVAQDILRTKFERQQRVADRENQRAADQLGYGNGPLMYTSGSPLADAPGKGSRQVTINSTSNTHIHGGDPEEVKKAVAEGHVAVPAMLERAGNEH